MQIELGKDVIASDGEKLGTVDRLVLDSDTNDLTKFVVQKGFFLPEDRIVDLEFVSSIDTDGTIMLSVPSHDERSLPAFVEESFRVANDDELNYLGYDIYAGAVPYAPVWFAPSATPQEQYKPAEEPFFRGAHTPPGVVETRDNLPEDSVSITTGTDVYGVDGDKVGEVDEILADENGQVSGIVVKAGFIFKHDVQIPMMAVDQVGSEQILLNITRDQAESQYSVN
jgi:uncharacterized protein YrrD